MMKGKKSMKGQSTDYTDKHRWLKVDKNKGFLYNRGNENHNHARN